MLDSGPVSNVRSAAAGSFEMAVISAKATSSATPSAKTRDRPSAGRQPIVIGDIAHF